MTYSPNDMDQMLNSFRIRSVEEPTGLSNVVKVDDEHIHLENIVCKDHEGYTFEEYPRLLVCRNVEKDDDGSFIHMGYADSVNYLDAKEHFLPSMALLCNIIDVIDESYTFGFNSDSTQNVLDEFLEWHFTRHGLFKTNTLVNYKHGQVNHYPWASDIKSTLLMNVPDRIHRYFDPESSLYETFETNLKTDNAKRLMQNLMGMEEPDKMMKIARNYTVNVKCKYDPSSEAKKDDAGLALFGMSEDNTLNIMTGDENQSVIRGVKLG